MVKKKNPPQAPMSPEEKLIRDCLNPKTQTETFAEIAIKVGARAMQVAQHVISKKYGNKSISNVKDDDLDKVDTFLEEKTCECQKCKKTFRAFIQYAVNGGNALGIHSVTKDCDCLRIKK